MQTNAAPVPSQPSVPASPAFSVFTEDLARQASSPLNFPASRQLLPGTDSDGPCQKGAWICATDRFSTRRRPYRACSAGFVASRVSCWTLWEAILGVYSWVYRSHRVVGCSLRRWCPRHSCAEPGCFCEVSEASEKSADWLIIDLNRCASVANRPRHTWCWEQRKLCFVGNEGRHAALSGRCFLRALASEEGVTGLTLAETRMSDFTHRLLNRHVALTADIGVEVAETVQGTLVLSVQPSARGVRAHTRTLRADSQRGPYHSLGCSGQTRSHHTTWDFMVTTQRVSVSVRYTFIHIGMKLSLFIPKMFIQNHFHPKTTFIQDHFHPIPPNPNRT